MSTFHRMSPSRLETGEAGTSDAWAVFNESSPGVGSNSWIRFPIVSTSNIMPMPCFELSGNGDLLIQHSLGAWYITTGTGWFKYLVSKGIQNLDIQMTQYANSAGGSVPGSSAINTWLQLGVAERVWTKAKGGAAGTQDRSFYMRFRDHNTLEEITAMNTSVTLTVFNEKAGK